MFIVYGKQTARIKRYTENHQKCSNCGTFDLEVRVYRSYYHLFFVPFFPFGPLHTEISCKHCGRANPSASLQQQYESQTKTPFYLYSLLILIALGIGFAVWENQRTQVEKSRLAKSPVKGDVYTVRDSDKGATTYYFLRVADVIGDTVLVLHSNLEYDGFVSAMAPKDHFVKSDTLYYLKKEIRQLQDSGVIVGIDREYDAYKGFSRTQ